MNFAFYGGRGAPDQELLPEKDREQLTVSTERAEQKAQYAERMEKIYTRLEKYALDPDNKKLYGGRKDSVIQQSRKMAVLLRNSLIKLRIVV